MPEERKQKNPRIAIHDRPGSFSDRWIDLCKQRYISYQAVNCYENTIIARLAHFDILLWHWHQNEHVDRLIARHIIHASESMGLTVFPDTQTCWSFDDKVSQKYQLEAIGAPLVQTDVFYQREEAMKWLRSAGFPLVFKLRCGASSMNVRLARTLNEAVKLTNQAFDRGFPFHPGHLASVRDHVHTSAGKADAGPVRSKKSLDLIGKVSRYWQRSSHCRQRNRLMGREIGYILFQEFIPDNTCDTRITVIGKSAFGFTRNVRHNDWRASGSGNINYDVERVDIRCVRSAFDIARRLKCQSIAFDFLTLKNCEPQIVEISYCYNAQAVYDCPGHWNADLDWVEGHIWPQDLIFDLVLAQHNESVQE